MKKDIYIVDVFAEQPYSGNPLAVVVTDQELSKNVMQSVAAEMNFSETTFVLPMLQDNGGYNIRIYTPSREIEFAGHPLLGTAHVIRQYLKNDSGEDIKLNLMHSQVTLLFETDEQGKDSVWFNAPPIVSGEVIEIEPVAHALNLSCKDIDKQLPIQVFSAGTAAMIVPLCSSEALRKCKLDLDKFKPLAEKGLSPLVYLFTRETYNADNDYSVRFFFDAHGVREDPATGNGAAFFGHYLLEHKVLPESHSSILIEQGHELRRPSLIMLRTNKHGSKKEVRVGGYVVTTVIGELV